MCFFLCIKNIANFEVFYWNISMSANLLFMNSGNWSESQILSFCLKKHFFPVAKVFEEWTDLILPYSIDKQNNGTNGKFFSSSSSWSLTTMPNGLLNAYRRPRRHTLHFCFGARDQRIASYSMNRKNAPLTGHSELKSEHSLLDNAPPTT